MGAVGLRTLGLDTGIACLGWAILEGDSLLIDCGQSQTPRGSPMGARLAELEKDVTYLFTTFQPTQVGIEFPFFDRSNTSQAKVLSALGVLSLVCHAHQVVPSLYHPSQVKSTVAHGKADKAEVAWAMEQLLGVEGVKDDVSDACAIAYCRAIGLESRIKW